MIREFAGQLPETKDQTDWFIAGFADGLKYVLNYLDLSDEDRERINSTLDAQ